MYNKCSPHLLMQHFYLPQETKVKQAPQTKVVEYPEIEKFIPYDPLGNYVSRKITDFCSPPMVQSY